MLLQRRAWEWQALLCRHFVPCIPVKGAHVCDHAIPAYDGCHGFVRPHELAQALGPQGLEALVQRVDIQMDRVAPNLVLNKALQVQVISL